MTRRDQTARSRRAALRTGAAVGLGLALPSVARTADARTLGARTPDARTAESVRSAGTPELTVATRNLGLGANLFSLFAVEDQEDLARTVGDLYADIERSAPTERMGAIAAELVRTRPDVIGVQEAALVRTEEDGDGGEGSPDAETVAFDFLADLTAALEDAGEPYEVTQVTTNADAEFPGLADGERIDVRLTDRDAVLARADADIEVTDTSSATFENALTVPVGDDRTYRVDRGYGAVDATVRGESVAVVNTHLESVSERTRGAQAEELAAALEREEFDDTTVLLGDLNDGPAFGGGAYETLADGRTDAWAATRDGDGYTCCRATTLDGPGSMDERVDHVLVGSGFAPAEARLVGADEGSRLTATVDGESRTVWPSDHAGLVTTLRVGTAEAIETATETPAADATTTETADGAETDAGSDGGDADAGEGALGTGTPPTDTVAGSPGDSSDGTTNTEANGESSADAAPETGTEAPGFGPLAGALGVLGGAAELLRRRRREN